MKDRTALQYLMSHCSTSRKHAKSARARGAAALCLQIELYCNKNSSFFEQV